MLHVLVFIAAMLVWYYLPYRKQDTKTKVKAKYTKLALLSSGFGCVILMYLVEYFVSYVCTKLKVQGLIYIIISSIIEAGILYEFVKFMIAKSFIKPSGAKKKIDYMMLFGACGLGVDMVEIALSLVTGGTIGLYVRSALCLNLFWQFFMGAHYYEAKKAAHNGDTSRAKSESAKMLLIPILLHSLVETGISVIEKYQDTPLFTYIGMGIVGLAAICQMIIMIQMIGQLNALTKRK